MTPMNSICMRLLFTFILFVFAAALPWWAFLILATTLSVYYPRFWEGILAALFFDTLYGSSTGIIPHLAFSMTLYAVLLYAIVHLVRRRLFTRYAL